MKQGRQQMGQQMGQLGQGMGQGMGGGNSALGQQLMKQIQQMKEGLGYGGYGQRGQSSSGWGLGTTPYAADSTPADPNNVVEDRQGDQSLGDTAPIDFEPLYAPEEYAHGFTSENQLHGAFDPSAMPEKVEEVRSAPEDQESLVEYSDIVGAYAEGEESAINRDQVPLEYQALVRDYFTRVAELSNDNATVEDDAGEEEATEPEGEEPEGEG